MALTIEEFEKAKKLWRQGYIPHPEDAGQIVHAKTNLSKLVTQGEWGFLLAIVWTEAVVVRHINEAIEQLKERKAEGNISLFKPLDVPGGDDATEREQSGS